MSISRIGKRVYLSVIVVICVAVLVGVVWFCAPVAMGHVIGQVDRKLYICDGNDLVYEYEWPENREIIKAGHRVFMVFDRLNAEPYVRQIRFCFSLGKSEKELDFSSEKYGMFGREIDFAEVEKLMQTMTRDEKIGQLLLIRYPDNAEEEIRHHAPGGVVFFGKDFEGKTREQVQHMTSQAQRASKIPLLTAVDEEGGRVVRISSNPLLADKPFPAPSILMNSEDWANIVIKDVHQKHTLLQDLGINLNLAPVADVSTNEKDYIYPRTTQRDNVDTASYIAIVVGQRDKTMVANTIKHFPGYGANLDTHVDKSLDMSDLDYVLNHNLLPFKMGVIYGAESIMVSHNIVACLDDQNPSSLSATMHRLLRHYLQFSGIAMTDDLFMGAITHEPQAALRAVLAGNNLLIVSDYKRAISELRTAIEQGRLNERWLEKSVARILAWKIYREKIKNCLIRNFMMTEMQKNKSSK